jgi:hypothetical protein
VNDEHLTWNSLTAPSRIMLPWYLAHFLIIALNFLLAPISRLVAHPTLEQAHALVNLRVWGVLFALAFVLMVLAFATKSRMMFRYALYLGATVLLIWAAVLGSAVVFNQASFSAWAWPFGLALACYASNLSLLGKK